MKKGQSKKQWEREHARKRAKQRYGFSYNNKVLFKIKEKIANNKTLLIERQSLKNTLRIVEIDGNYLKFVWDSKRKEVVTFLPMKQKDLLFVEDKTMVKSIPKPEENSVVVRSIKMIL